MDFKIFSSIIDFIQVSYEKIGIIFKHHLLNRGYYEFLHVNLYYFKFGLILHKILKMNKLSYFFFITWLISFHAFAQEKTLENLENERLANQKRIQEIDNILQETRQKHQNNEASLRALNTQKQNVENLTHTINKEIDLLRQKIDETTQDIAQLENTLQEYTDEYKAMVYMASKTNNKVEKLSFLFSSESVQQLMARLEYFDQYAESRKKQIKAIKEIRDELHAQKTELEEQKVAKEELLRQNQIEKQRLDVMKGERSQMIRKLKAQEQQLMLDLQKQKQINSQLEEVLTSTVEKSLANPSNLMRKIPENQLKGTSFIANQSNLLWPIQQGFVSKKFGKQPHPVEPKITIDNLGIDIRTPTNESVKAVFSGVVVIVYHVPGDIGQTIMIQHDTEYFTVYKNLKNIQVEQGQSVKAHQEIGQVQANADNISELQFQVWKNKTRLNPAEWLSSL